MLSLRKGLSLSAGLVSLAMAGTMSLAPMASADGTGQIEGGNIYLIKNLTQNTAYSNSASANACDELEYSIRLHNSGFTAVNDINVAVTLAGGASTSNASTMTATYTNGVVPSTSATATVSLSTAQSISYESGTTKLYDGQDNLIKTLPDTVTGQGVNVGDIDGSTTEFLNFKAKVNCPTPPPTPTPTPTPTPSTPAPTVLVNTGAGSVIGLFAATSVAGAAAYRWILGRRLSRQ